MAFKMSRHKLTVVLIGLSIFAIYFVSPWLQLLSVRNAVRDQDVVKLEKYVDWDSVRNGLKSDMTAFLTERVSAEDNDFVKGVALLVGPAMIDHLVSTISASTLLKLVQQKNMENKWETSDLIVFKASYTGLDEFSVWLGDDGDSRMVMFFEHFHWVVKRVIFGNEIKKRLAQQDSTPPATPQAQSALPDAEQPKDDILTNGKNSLRIHYDDKRSLFGNNAFLNDQKIVENDYVATYKAFPNKIFPSIVLIADECGGSACSSTNLTLVDMTTSPPTTQDSLCVPYDSLVGGPKDDLVKIDYNDDQLTIDAESCQQNKFGDQLKSSYIYDRKRHVLYLDGTFDKSSLDFANKHPEILFDENSSYRPTLIKILGDQYKEARQALGVSSGLTMKMGRYLVATGCVPHACGNGATIVIDVVSKDTWVSWMYSDGVLHFRGTRPLIRSEGSPDEDVSYLLRNGASELVGDKGEKVYWPDTQKDVPLENFDLDYRTKVKDVSIEGRFATDRATLVKAIGVDESTPMLSVNPDMIRAKILEIPNIEKATVLRHFPDTIVIQIKEKGSPEKLQDIRTKGITPDARKKANYPAGLSDVIGSQDWPYVKQALTFGFSLGNQKDAVQWANTKSHTHGTIFQSGDGTDPEGCRQFRVTNLSRDPVSGNVDVCPKGQFK